MVALTAHVVGAAADAWSAAGMDGVLHKPFTLASLARTLGQFLAPSDGCAEAADDSPLLDPRVDADLSSMGDKAGFVARIRGLYRQHAPETVSRLKAALAVGEAEEAARAAH